MTILLLSSKRLSELADFEGKALLKEDLRERVGGLARGGLCGVRHVHGIRGAMTLDEPVLSREELAAILAEAQLNGRGRSAPTHRRDAPAESALAWH